MKIKASGRWALMIATGIFAGLVSLGLAGPLPAHAAGSDTAASKSDSAASDVSARQNARHGKRTAHHGSSRTADKSESKKAADGDAGSVTSAGIPASVANANAELTAGDNNAAPAKPNTTLAAADKPGDGQPAADVVASDQLNDVDRALQEQQQAAEPQQAAQPQTAQQDPPPPAQSQTVAIAPPKPAPVLASNESSSLDQTSLIGKIFIGFGALLTVASAARMFMA